MAEIPREGVIPNNNKGGQNKRTYAVVRKQKVSLGQICDSVYAMISGQDLNAPKFPGKYHVAVDASRKRLLLKEGAHETVHYASNEEMTVDIAAYLSEHYSHLDDYKLTPENLDTIVRYFMIRSNALSKDPEPFRELSDPGLCFRRLPFDIGNWSTAEMPLFNEFLNRTTNGDAFCAYVGSLFFPQADKQQYLYLYGSGGNGKGAILRLLARIFDKAYASEDATLAVNNRFWTSGLLGKRLVAFPDTNFSAFLRTGLLKSLTGDDAVRMERKNKDQSSSELNAKLMFLSNKKPDISGEKADVRRLIYCAVGDFEGDPDPGYNEKLWKEAPIILAFCKAAYLQLCPHHGPIPVDKDQLDDVVDESDEEYEAAFEAMFKKELGTSGITRAEFRRALKSNGYANNRWIADFKAYMERVHQIKVTRPGTAERTKVYCTLQLKSFGATL